MKKRTASVAVLGAGLAGSSAALTLARAGVEVTLFERLHLPVNAASLHNEGKLHLGYVYALDKASKTHLKMIEGSLQFLGIIEHLTGVARSNFTASSPFLYIVPNTTMLSFKDVLEHAETVDSEIASFLSKENRFVSPVPLARANAIPVERTRHWFNPDAIQGAVQTAEIAVSPIKIANIVSAAALTHDKIRFKGNCEIAGASCEPEGAYQIHYRENGQSMSQSFDAAINCLWEDRLRVDKTLGIAPPRSSITRYKATITFFDRTKAYADVPSTTLVVGAYGDVVNYRNGLYYLSWYPGCKMGESVNGALEDIKHSVSALDNSEQNKRELIFSSIEQLAEFIPAIEKFKRIADKGKVGGGFICGWGKTDIQDVDSGLHSRSDIGVDAHERWVSVNTGKYCTAPLFGLRAASQLLDLL